MIEEEREKGEEGEGEGEEEEEGEGEEEGEEEEEEEGEEEGEGEEEEEEEGEGLKAWRGAASSSRRCPLAPGSGGSRVRVARASVRTVRVRSVGLSPKERIFLCPFQATGSPWAGQAPAKA